MLRQSAPETARQAFEPFQTCLEPLSSHLQLPRGSLNCPGWPPWDCVASLHPSLNPNPRPLSFILLDPNTANLAATDYLQRAGWRGDKAWPV